MRARPPASRANTPAPQYSPQPASSGTSAQRPGTRNPVARSAPRLARRWPRAGGPALWAPAPWLHALWARALWAPALWLHVLWAPALWARALWVQHTWVPAHLGTCALDDLCTWAPAHLGTWTSGYFHSNNQLSHRQRSGASVSGGDSHSRRPLGPQSGFNLRQRYTAARSKAQLRARLAGVESCPCACGLCDLGHIV